MFAFDISKCTGVLIGSAIAEAARPHGVQTGVKVDFTNHYLQYGDGRPFFWLGDTGWELFQRLNKDEEEYLENCRKKGFNVIQAVILAEFNGLKEPNQYGELPLKDLNPETPNEKYFELVDWTLQLALKKEIVMGLLPTWGDKVTLLWGNGPVVFNEANAYKYGFFLGKRYKKFSHSLDTWWCIGYLKMIPLIGGLYGGLWQMGLRKELITRQFLVTTFQVANSPHLTTYITKNGLI